jgi:hypothetical protein
MLICRCLLYVYSLLIVVMCTRDIDVSTIIVAKLAIHFFCGYCRCFMFQVNEGRGQENPKSLGFVIVTSLHSKILSLLLTFCLITSNSLLLVSLYLRISVSLIYSLHWERENLYGCLRDGHCKGEERVGE